MADTTLPALLDTGTHAARPAASAVGTGALYSCTDHSLIYQTDGSSWTTWATLGSAGGDANVTDFPASTLQAMRWGTPSITGSLAASRLYVARYIPQEDASVGTAYWQCSTSAGNLDFGIYSANLATLHASTGSFASPGTGARSQALSGTVNLVAGTTYYLAMVTDSTTLRIPSVQPPSALGSPVNLYGIQSSHGIPMTAAPTITWDAGGAVYPTFFVG